jgi:transcriptional regulator with XRE-family HTH domain
MSTPVNRYKKNKEALKNVGLNIQKYRLLKGWSREQLYFRSEIQPKSLYQYEHGLVNINVTAITAIADALEIHAYQLLMKYER